MGKQKRSKYLCTMIAVTFVASLSLVGQGQAGPGASLPRTMIELPGGGVYQGSVTLADLNDDDKLELLVGSGRDYDGQYRGNGYLHAVSWQGAVLWSAQGRTAGELGIGEVQPPINSSPSVIPDINNDGWDDVIIGLGGEASASNWDGGLAAFSGQSGQRLWIFNSDDWLYHAPDGHLDGVFATPAVGDVDGDGDYEIAFSSWDQCIYLLDHLGQPLWTNPVLPRQGHCNGNHGYYNEDTLWSSPAMADLDGDGRLEIIVGADVSLGNQQDDPEGGYLYVFSAGGGLLGRAWLDQVIWSSPAVGDIDGDGQPEIVVGSGHFYPGMGHYVTAWNYTAGAGLSLKRTWSTSGQVFSSPALADLNGDGRLDVVAMSYIGDWNTCQGSQVYAWRGDSGAALSGFPVTPRTVSGKTNHCIMASPTVADIDNDSHLEILFTQAGEVTIINHDGTHYTGSGATQSGLLANCSLSNSPAVGDVDNDGDLEIAAGGMIACGDPKKGALYVWQTSALSSNAQPWPIFHHDARHTGYYPKAPQLSVDPASILVLHEYGDASDEQFVLTIRNTGGDAFDWVATPPAGVSLSPSSGHVVTETRLTGTIDIPSGTSFVIGAHNLGNIQIQATFQGSPVAGSPLHVPVVLKVVEVLYRTFLPFVIK